MPTDLRKLACYYRDVLTVLSENSGRALRDLRLGRRYGMVADLSVYKITFAQLLDSDTIALDRILPELRTDGSTFAQEPGPGSDEIPPGFDETIRPEHHPSESPALIRIWRKQKQDTYNRETLLGLGLLRGATDGRRQIFAPLVCFRVRPDYDIEKRRYTITRASGTPFPNLTLLAQLMTEEELREIRPHLHGLLTEAEFGEVHFERLVKAISGSAASMRDLRLRTGRLWSYPEVLRLEIRDLPLLATGAVLLNIPRGNAYLLDDLEKLATEANDEDLARTAIGPLLEVPSDENVHDRNSFPQSDSVELLFPFESNKAQREVGKLATHSRTLVVHGPPGTGKSQTICNLVSHLVACGKTVLVTSQKDKALEVVRDKLPKIDYLAMALLRSDQESQKALLQALEYSQAAAGYETSQKLEQSKNFVLQRLKENRRMTFELQARFSEMRRLEHRYLPTFRKLRDLRNSSNDGHARGWATKAANALQRYRHAWVVSRVNVKNPADTRTVCGQLRQLVIERRNLVIQLLSLQRRIHLHQAWQKPGTAFAIQLAKKLLSKKKKTVSLEKIKERIKFKDLLAVFPCWILSIDDVARIFPLEAGLFDYLIVDEASQCNQATALHLAFRAKQMVVVGDEKQLPNASVQWVPGGTIEQLLARHGLDSHPKREFLSVHESLLGLSLGSCGREVHLNEHFRCDPKIIEWSNHEFYGDSLRILTPLRSMRFSTPIEVRYITGATEDTETSINEREAEKVVDEISRILDDPKLKGLSLGVISPFQPQADYIYALLHERFADRWEECERRGLTSSTADGFQGDERDIILYSLRHGPGSHPGSITGIEANQGDRRLNVAFTRARRKVILFTSMAPGTFPGRFIRGFLDHAEVSQCKSSLADTDRDKFDSDFEREVCERFRAKKLDVATQFPVAGYRIDLVVRDKAGRRMGVECDGAFHYDEYGQLREEDYEREEILERAGWAIHRIPARRYYMNPAAEIDLAVQALRDQPTDEEVSELEFEDLAPPHVEEDERAEAIVAPPPDFFVQTRAQRRSAPSVPPSTDASLLTPFRSPPFDEHAPWIGASRWARDIGHWTYANRVFLWQVGDKIREGKALDQSEKVRAAALWANALRQGYRPERSTPAPRD
jgi:very-short-patch-repair endonuclease/DNA polymerase III delta prime subunit